jgi:hypothetical protein
MKTAMCQKVRKHNTPDNSLVRMKLWRIIAEIDRHQSEVEKFIKELREWFIWSTLLSKLKSNKEIVLKKNSKCLYTVYILDGTSFKWVSQSSLTAEQHT